MDSLGQAATRRYVTTITVITAAAMAFLADALYIHPGPLSTRQKVFAIFLALAGTLTQYTLGSEHKYFKQMARNGCGPLNSYANDPVGLRYLLSMAKSLKTHSLLEDRQEMLNKLGHTYWHRLFPEPCQSITTDEPENIKAVLAAKFEDWVIPEHRISGFRPVLGLHSIFTVNQPEWQHSRAMLRPSFQRDQISDLEVFDRHITKLMSKIPKDGSPVDLQDLFSMLTIDSISDFMFGQSTDVLGTADPRNIKFGAYFDTSVNKISRRARLSWLTQILPDRELNECTSFQKQYVQDFINQVKEQIEKGALKSDKKYVFLHELIKSGEPDQVIRDQLLSIYLAGRDTTTSVLSYLFMELSRRPDVVEEIQKEIRELGSKDPSWEELKNMKYLNWSVKEALRLNPPVPFNAREAIRDTILPTGGGPDGKSPVFVTKGTNVRYIPWAMHRRKDVYGPDAEEFRPERWESLKVTYEYLPFNGGPRICLGQQFALTQLAMVTFRLLQAFKTIERKDDRPPVQRLSINTSMLYGCWVSMTAA